jgi:uncharacterized protein (TIGR01777 family)
MNGQLQGPIVIAGGSGFLGTSLARHLADAALCAGLPTPHIIILSRRAPKTSGPWQHIFWDARTLGDWRTALNGASGLVNLAGRSVDCVKTPDHQDEILRSRVEATLVLGKALRAIESPPPVWVQMSTAHIYGDPPSAICSEDSPPGYGRAPIVARAWEDAYHASVLPSQRQVILRTSFVIGRDRGCGGGALTRLKFLTKLGLGGPIGSGTQGFSWIHESDLNRLFLRALTDDSMHGTYIASSPNPVSQRVFMHALRRALHIPIGLPAPAWLVHLAAPLLLNTDPDLALYGRYVVSSRLAIERFEFQFPDLPQALAELVS